MTVHSRGLPAAWKPLAGLRVTGAGQQISVALEDVALATAGNLGFLAEAEVNGAYRDSLAGLPRAGLSHQHGPRRDRGGR